MSGAEDWFGPLNEPHTRGVLNPFGLREKITAVEADRRYGPPRHELIWQLDVDAMPTRGTRSITISNTGDAPLPELPFAAGPLLGTVRLARPPEMRFDRHRAAGVMTLSVQLNPDITWADVLAAFMPGVRAV